MNKFVPIPDHIRGCTNAEDAVSFLKTLEINQKIQLRTKFKSLDENWTDCIAVRERNSWSMKFQGEEESSLVSATNYDDGDEENSLISADNWMMRNQTPQFWTWRVNPKKQRVQYTLF